MPDQILVRRYARGLVGALAEEPEFAAVLQELSAFCRLLQTNRELAAVLENPFVAKKKKDKIIKDILAASPPGGKTMRFLGVLIEHNRLGLLDDILLAVPELWRERQGVQTFEVSSTVPLSAAQTERLRRELERLEQRPVFLEFRIDPALVGGLSVRKGNTIYDASVQGRLDKLKEKMMEG